MTPTSKPPYRTGRAQPRDDTTGQYARMPEGPEEVLKAGGRPDKWAPGLGVGTAPSKDHRNPELPTAPVKPPFRNLTNGRK